ncbi:MAG: lytic transglycosylase domain-containing protein [Candidatus Binatus sp.]|uniref:lytic transglycosylase domain-containing protein n=1 Tax=Candidatus Binatus sp. TaxID=2811406 RepID=UPI002716464E|nr:lytic transglycosylase domain-containing protein [Candidatus Binatus sp.]MDO8432788.1 lytic transglycosylase domain-containing protein [Candidatus Binatus sp.]
MMLALVPPALLSLGLPVFAQQVGSYQARQDIDYQSLFAVVGTMYSIDPHLLNAIARVESAGNPNAISSAGAIGLMQLEPPTAADFGVYDLFDPVQNTLGAARYIDYLRRHQQTAALSALPAILAAYNAGEKGAGNRGVDSAPAETRRYVRDVLMHYLLDGTPSPAWPVVERVSNPPATPKTPKPEAAAAIPRGARQTTTRRVSDREILDQLSSIGERRKLALERQENSQR